MKGCVASRTSSTTGHRTPGNQLCHRASLPSGTTTVATGDLDLSDPTTLPSLESFTTVYLLIPFTTGPHDTADECRQNLRGSGQRRGSHLENKRVPRSLHLPWVKNRHSLDHFPASSNYFSPAQPGFSPLLFVCFSGQLAYGVDLSFTDWQHYFAILLH